MKELSDQSLRDLAGKQSFERGVRYFQQGRVEIHGTGAGSVRATVNGTEPYRVTLTLTGKNPEWDCECSAADDGSFCKHLVATALAVRDISPDKTTTDDAELLGFLKRQSAEKLAGWLWRVAQFDSEVERRLQLYRTQSDPRAFKKSLSSLLRARDLFGRNVLAAFARNLDTAMESLRDIARHDPVVGLELCEYALERLLKLYARSDDSSGLLAHRVQDCADLYVEMCKVIESDSTERGLQLLKLQGLDEWTFLPLPVLWPLMGETARNVYSQRLSAEFAKLPPAADNSADRSRWMTEFPVIHRMEELARVTGDTDLLIRVLSRDLSSAYGYERLVKTCRDAGREREATQWAERGVKAHPDKRGMRSLLAEEYERDGLRKEALTLLKEEFELNPEPQTWARFKKAAGSQWKNLRSAALEHVEHRERTLADGRRDVSARIRLLLADGDVETARTLGETQAAGLGDLQQLADAVVKSHPASAALFLKCIVDATLPRSGPQAYTGIAEQVRTILSLDPSPATQRWLADLKSEYRARRKLMALLE